MFATDEGYIDDDILSPAIAPSGADPRLMIAPREVTVQEREGASLGLLIVCVARPHNCPRRTPSLCSRTCVQDPRFPS